MSTHNICFREEISKIISRLSSENHPNRVNHDIRAWALPQISDSRLMCINEVLQAAFFFFSNKVYKPFD